MKMFLLLAENDAIEKSAKFIVLGENVENVMEKFSASFIAQSGMKVKTVTEIPDFYMVWP